MTEICLNRGYVIVWRNTTMEEEAIVVACDAWIWQTPRADLEPSPSPWQLTHVANPPPRWQRPRCASPSHIVFNIHVLHHSSSISIGVIRASMSISYSIVCCAGFASSSAVAAGCQAFLLPGSNSGNCDVVVAMQEALMSQCFGASDGPW